jgi:hypothetical protein
LGATPIPEGIGVGSSPGYPLVGLRCSAANTSLQQRRLPASFHSAGTLRRPWRENQKTPTMKIKTKKTGK